MYNKNCKKQENEKIIVNSLFIIENENCFSKKSLDNNYPSGCCAKMQFKARRARCLNYYCPSLTAHIRFKMYHTINSR